MNAQKYRKAELVERIQKNRDNHRQVFDLAMEGYLQQAKDKLNYAVKEIGRSRVPNFYALVELPVPEDHTKDYDAVLAMLAMSVANEIEMSESDFRSYVLDEWRWKSQFIGTASNYTVISPR